MSLSSVLAPEWKSSEHGSLLASPHGQQFAGAFKALRLNHVLVDYSSVAILEGDGIIPNGQFVCWHYFAFYPNLLGAQLCQLSCTI